MEWQVILTDKAEKRATKLPKSIMQILRVLMGDIATNGPVRGNWPNYGKLGVNRHHCHLKKGKPCYVAVWEVTDKGVKLIEVTYAGTHEKAPY